MVESGAFWGIGTMGSTYNSAFPACALALPFEWFLQA
jgi:hypothetical protein